MASARSNKVNAILRWMQTQKNASETKKPFRVTHDTYLKDTAKAKHIIP